MSGSHKVAVVGGGTVGTFAAWSLAQRGIDVTIFERFRLGHEFGAYSGETRIYRRKYIEGPEYDELLEYSENFWLELDCETTAPLFTRTGVISVGQESSHLIKSLLASQRALGLDAELFPADVLSTKLPGIEVQSDYVGVEDADGGLLRPEAILAHMWQKLADAGVRFRERTPVLAIQPHVSSATLHLPSGTPETFDHVLVAVGAWTNELLGGQIPHVDVQRLAVHWYPVRSGVDMSQMPVAMIDRGFDFCVWPSIDGVSIKVGLNLGVDRPANLQNLDKTMPWELAQFVDSIVKELIPGAYPRAIRQAVQMEGWSPDRQFIIGRSPRSDRVLLGAGFSAHGFKMAPAIGEALARIADCAETGFDLSPFAPNRFTPNTTIEEYVNGGFVNA